MKRAFSLMLNLLILSVLVNSAFAQDRILWRFDMDTPISGYEVAIGPDGTVFGSDDTKLYALNPDGTIKWVTSTVRDNTSVAFLPDGTIITRFTNTIYALNPSDGSVVWTFSYPSNGVSSQIEVGPSVGPDGNIYAVSSINNGYGLGAFSLTPQGGLRWNNEGNPILSMVNSHTDGPVYFTQDRMIFPFAIDTIGGQDVYGFDLDGHQTLNNVDFTCLGIPRTDPLNRLLLASACGVEAIEQDGNEIHWRVQFGPVNLAPAIGADATLYTGAYFGDVNAVNPDGSIKWTSNSAGFAQRMIAVRQDANRLIYSGAENFGIQEFVAGVDTDDGTLLWQEFLRTVDGHHELMWTQRAVTSADGSTVYFATRYTSNAVPGSIYAVRITDTVLTGIDGAVPVPAAFELAQNHPNPFNPMTEIAFVLPAEQRVHLAIYSIDGQRIATLVNDVLPGGRHEAVWTGLDARGRPAASGIYFYMLQAGDFSDTKRMMLLK